MRGSKEETILELAPPEKNSSLERLDLSFEKIQQCQKVKNLLTDRASAQPGHIRARLVRVLRTAVAEIRIPL